MQKKKGQPFRVNPYTRNTIQSKTQTLSDWVFRYHCQQFSLKFSVCLF